MDSLAELHLRRTTVEALGCEWCGEYGLPRQRYCTKDDEQVGRPAPQLHYYEIGSPEIMRRLAFRDFLQENLVIAAEYDEVKASCQRLYSDNSFIMMQLALILRWPLPSYILWCFVAAVAPRPCSAKRLWPNTSRGTWRGAPTPR